MVLLLNRILKIAEIFINKKPLFSDFEEIYQFIEQIQKGLITQDVQKYVLLSIQILFINFNSNLYYLFQKQINLEEQLKKYRQHYNRLLEVYLSLFDFDFLGSLGEQAVFSVKMEIFNSVVNLLCLTSSDVVSKHKFIYIDIQETAIRKLIGFVAYTNSIEQKVEFFLDKSYSNMNED
jgi:hypothetical protein